jgi:hypothetical protein
VSAALAVELLSALNTILQFARDNGVSSRVLLNEYLVATAEGRQLTQADVTQAKRQARDALDKLNALTRTD